MIFTGLLSQDPSNVGSSTSMPDQYVYLPVKFNGADGGKIITFKRKIFFEDDLAPDEIVVAKAAKYMQLNNGTTACNPFEMLRLTASWGEKAIFLNALDQHPTLSLDSLTKTWAAQEATSKRKSPWANERDCHELSAFFKKGLRQPNRPPSPPSNAKPPSPTPPSGSDPQVA